MKTDIEDLKKKAKEIRRDICILTSRSNSSHLGSALSTVDILVGLYFNVMKIDPTKPSLHDRDRLILSKGHAAVALYTTLVHRGFFSREILGTFYKNGSKLAGHVTRGAPGIECSTGSLGHGLSMGLGMALAAKGKYRIFVILSDGECDEGSTWEPIMLAPHLKIDNLTVIVDYNKIQSFGTTKEVLDLEPFADKWRSFGWSVKEIDGHNFSEILGALESVPFKKGRPSVIIAHTTKGKGVSFAENKLEWHYKSLNQQQLVDALQELDAR